MRPGLVFLGLSVLLAVEYKGLAGALPLAIIFVVQFATVLVLLAVALRWRRLRERKPTDHPDDRSQGDR